MSPIKLKSQSGTLKLKDQESKIKLKGSTSGGSGVVTIRDAVTLETITTVNCGGVYDVLQVSAIIDLPPYQNYIIKDPNN